MLLISLLWYVHNLLSSAHKTPARDATGPWPSSKTQHVRSKTSHVMILHATAVDDCGVSFDHIHKQHFLAKQSFQGLNVVKSWQDDDR